MVGGFTANGDAVMPILEAAGIPWFAPPGISAAELSSEDSYPITSGVLGLAGLGQMAAEDGCDKVASVNFDLPSAGSISQLVDLALTNAGPRAVDADQGAPDDHRLQRHRAGGQRLRLRRGRHRAAAVPRHRGRGRPARQHDEVLRRPRRSHRRRGPQRWRGGRGCEVALELPRRRRPDLGRGQEVRRRPGGRGERRLVRALLLQHLGRLPHPAVPDQEQRPTSARPGSRRPSTRPRRSTPTGSRRRSASPRTSRRRA